MQGSHYCSCHKGLIFVSFTRIGTYLLNEVNARLKVEPKVNEVPFDALLAVLLLLQHKHVVVEELLQLLIGEVDAQLLKGVHLEHNHKRSYAAYSLINYTISGSNTIKEYVKNQPP